ncbi:MAG TPA: response regulator transcription factor [Verrucomicrobiae bacterium]|nr:response regulator transcription factor [Verrucomicrobiae bacterium]
MRILVAEPSLPLGSYLEGEFSAQGIAVELALAGEHARSRVLKQDYDAVVLDVDLPGEDGFEILRRIRAAREHLPVLILTAGAKPGQRATALDLGADDLLLKPFAFAELLARVRAVMRRGGHRADPVLKIDNLELSRAEHQVTRAGRRIRLTPKEFALLEYLLANAGQHVTRAEIVQHVWHHASDPLTNIVDVYVNYLRKKVDVPFESKLIHTVRGVGYRLESRKTPVARTA